MSKWLVLVINVGKLGIKNVNQSKLSFINFGIRPSKILKRIRELPDKCSSLRLESESIPSGSSVKQLSDMFKISSFSSSLVENVSCLSLFYASFKTIRLFLSYPISDGIISSKLQSKLMCVSFWHSLILPDKYFI